MFEYKPANKFAGTFPIVAETDTATAAIEAMQPITASFAPVTADTINDVIGIAAEAAEKDGPVNFYSTGEFFADSINLPDGVTIEALKPICRKLNIYFR
ncbi:MAG: hypothetical protein LKJ25_06100 [Clostridia bacterium]|jgi:hypothetical protein|nr:hypothetical protein [Clostridia bacterium]